MNDLLINNGIYVIGTVQSEDSPIVVVGVARGGTSMVAGVLSNLGVFMGDKASPPVFEDTCLADKMESSDFSGAKEIVANYKRIYRRFGWKRPSSIMYLEKVDEVFESPRYVFVFRDILAIAMRNSISMHSDVLMSMKDVLHQYSMVLSFIQAYRPRALLVSYEKGIASPETLISSLINFCDLNPTDSAINEAISFIRPNPSDYLDQSRITKAIGRLDWFSGNKVLGWARYVHRAKKAEVAVYLNGKLLGVVAADKTRPDLDERFGSPCAFVFELPNGILVRPGDVLRARVVDEVCDLRNSPLVIS